MERRGDIACSFACLFAHSGASWCVSKTVLCGADARVPAVQDIRDFVSEQLHQSPPGPQAPQSERPGERREGLPTSDDAVTKAEENNFLPISPLASPTTSTRKCLLSSRIRFECHIRFLSSFKAVVSTIANKTSWTPPVSFSAASGHAPNLTVILPPHP